MIAIDKDIELIKENIEFRNLRVSHFEEKIKNNNKKEYVLNIICCDFNNEKDLNDYWKVIVDNVALHVQSKLENIIELYNVYIIFFIEEINEQLIYEIEQDKYSSRKIVIKKAMPMLEEELEDIVSNRLFYFDIEKSEDNFSISETLKNFGKEFYEYIDSKDSIKDEDIDEIANILNKNSLGGDLIE
ncbi:ABC-three component system middle component 1 [Clostridium beijerinckii]|uniref:ABC-three component system middle component 1 n=1 Tax=Clostridium beijerinckii TaxID=1520 RepID=UPI000809D5E3|nr:ABC-three component system middle component 1 [Clostridium beijerinckii]OCB00112.1 hypothetical protein BGS1_12735 [Clostridium beijerinckii]